MRACVHVRANVVFVDGTPMGVLISIEVYIANSICVFACVFLTARDCVQTSILNARVRERVREHVCVCVSACVLCMCAACVCILRPVQQMHGLLYLPPCCALRKVDVTKSKDSLKRSTEFAIDSCSPPAERRRRTCHALLEASVLLKSDHHLNVLAVHLLFELSNLLLDLRVLWCLKKGGFDFFYRLAVDCAASHPDLALK